MFSLAFFFALILAKNVDSLGLPIPGLLPCQPTVVALSTILPEATIDYSTLTVSGLSAGAIMTMQYHFAHSSEVKGIGMFAGFPQGQFVNSTLGNQAASSLRFFVLGPVPFVPIPIPLLQENNAILEADARWRAEQGLIDSVSNIGSSKAYLFHGTVDPIVNHAYGVRAADMYEDFGADVRTNFNIAATHTTPTDNFPTPLSLDCPIFNLLADGINNCQYEGVFDMFSHLYGASYVAPSSSSATNTGTLYAFNQNGITKSSTAAADFMDEKGYLYVPLYCKNPAHTCKIHIALHGCLQSIYNDLKCNYFATDAGYAEVADSNNVVVVFPQASPIEGNLQLQSNLACWDFSGSVSLDYLEKTAPQIFSIRKISRIVAKLPV